jgi:hypothetical protein
MNVGDVQAQANAQNVGNAYTNAAFNRVDQTGPFGSVNYRQTGTDERGNPIFNQTTSIDPRETAFRQGAQGYYGAAAGNLQGMAAAGPGGNLERTLYDPEGLTRAGSDRLQQLATPADLSSGAAFDRAYDYAAANLEPRFERTRAAAENRLRNQGLDPTSEAYRASMNDLALQQNEARNNLVTSLQGQMFGQGLQERQQDLGEAQALYGAGTGRANQIFGQDQSIAGFANQRYGLGLQANQALGGLGISGIGASRTDTGAAPLPSVGVQNVDVAGLNNQANQQAWQNYNAQMQQRNAMLGGLASIGGSLMLAPMTGGGSLGGMIGTGLVNRLGGMMGAR